jgi:hypothetical protein
LIITLWAHSTYLEDLKFEYLRNSFRSFIKVIFICKLKYLTSICFFKFPSSENFNNLNQCSRLNNGFTTKINSIKKIFFSKDTRYILYENGFETKKNETLFPLGYSLKITINTYKVIKLEQRYL